MGRGDCADNGGDASRSAASVPVGTGAPVRAARRFAGALVAVLSGTRFAVEGRRFDLLLCGGFSIASMSWLAFSVVPAVAETGTRRTQQWAAIVGPMLGWALVAAAPFVRGRVRRRQAALWRTLAACAGALVIVWAVSRSVGALPNLDPATRSAVPPSLSGVLAGQALLNLLAVIGFGNRFRL